MNIFAVSKNTRKCARALDDIRLSKMILETAQMLCTVVNLRAGEQVTPYRNSHATNQLVLWASANDTNWSWLWDLGMELGREYHHRVVGAHKSYMVIQALPQIAAVYGIHLRSNPRPKKFFNAASHQGLGISYRHVKNTHKAYRKYLCARWKLQAKTPRKNGKIYPPKWTNRRKPKWK